MCDYSLDRMIERILADELVRLAMASDGVREDEMRRVLEQVHGAIVRHNSGTERRSLQTEPDALSAGAGCHA